MLGAFDSHTRSRQARLVQVSQSRGFRAFRCRLWKASAFYSFNIRFKVPGFGCGEDCGCAGDESTQAPTPRALHAHQNPTCVHPRRQFLMNIKPVTRNNDRCKSLLLSEAA